MGTLIDWIGTGWDTVIMQSLIFWVVIILSFWLRKMVYSYLKKIIPQGRWKANEKIIEAVWGPSALWCLFLSLYLALHVSSYSRDMEYWIRGVLWTILLISLTLPLLRLGGNTMLYYGRVWRMERGAIRLSRSVIRILILLAATRIALEIIWGVSNYYVLLVLVVAFLTVILAFRDLFPNFYAGIQIGARQKIRRGDYIKLETGEEGYLTKMGWSNIYLQTAEENTLIVPNSRLLQDTVINFGRPLRKATEPFRFNTRKIIKESTGLKAKNLAELAEKIKIVPSEVIYCHTYRRLEENPYMAYETPNDFAAWAKDVLGDPLLNQKLASVSIFRFTDITGLRDSIVSTIEEYLKTGYIARDVLPGREFYFLKAASVVMPTPYLAHDLREFVENLRKVSLDSLYFHIFGSRLHLGNGMNDFSNWLETSLGESDLGREISQINPYAYRPESFRSVLIQSIERRIK